MMVATLMRLWIDVSGCRVSHRMTPSLRVLGRAPGRHLPAFQRRGWRNATGSLEGPVPFLWASPLAMRSCRAVVAVVSLECFDVEKVVQNPPCEAPKYQNSWYSGKWRFIPSDTGPVELLTMRPHLEVFQLARERLEEAAARAPHWVNFLWAYIH